MTIVAPGICRYTVHGTLGTRPTANILDFRIDTTGSTESREEAIEAMCGIIINEWSDHVLPQVCAPYTATSVSWVDLDEEDGSTGSRTSTGQETWPKVATRSGTPAPANTSVLVTKVGSSRRGQRNGRLYLAGPPEGEVGTQNLTSTYQAAVQASMESMLGNMNQSETTLGEYESYMVIVHTRDVGTPGNPDIVFTGSSDVSALSVSGTAATQRRRLRG